jgi:hypothetical protein
LPEQFNFLNNQEKRWLKMKIYASTIGGFESKLYGNIPTLANEPIPISQKYQILYSI